MPRSPLKILDALLFAFSPLAIIMFIVGVIVLLDRAGSHQDFLRRLEQNSAVAPAVVDQVEPDWVIVRFTDPAQAEPRIGLVKPIYYPAALIAALKPGDALTVRYLTPASEGQAVLEDYYADLRGYWGFVWEPGILLLLSWLVIVRHPDFLFWGFIEDFGAVRKERAAP